MRPAFAVGLIATVVTLLSSSLVTNHELVHATRFLAGVFGAIAYVAGGAIAAQLASEPSRTSPLAICLAGGGIGIAVSGLTIPWLAGKSGAGWRHGWVGLGLLAAAWSLVAWWASDPPVTASERRNPRAARSASLNAIHVAYGLFGAGYIAYMTFVIELLRDRGDSVSFRSLFWVALGLAAADSSPIWSGLPLQLRGRREFALVDAATALGVVIVIPIHHPLVALVSAIAFGGSFLAVVGSVATLEKSMTPPERRTHVIGSLTGAFALGQCAGPLVSGALFDRPGGVETGLWLSVALLVGASVTALAQRELG